MVSGFIWRKGFHQSWNAVAWYKTTCCVIKQSRHFRQYKMILRRIALKGVYSLSNLGISSNLIGSLSSKRVLLTPWGVNAWSKLNKMESVNSAFVKSMKSILSSFIWYCLDRVFLISLRAYVLKQLSFSTSVNSGTIFNLTSKTNRYLCHGLICTIFPPEEILAELRALRRRVRSCLSNDILIVDSCKCQPAKWDILFLCISVINWSDFAKVFLHKQFVSPILVVYVIFEEAGLN